MLTLPSLAHTWDQFRHFAVVSILIACFGLSDAWGQVDMVTHGPPDVSLPRCSTDDQQVRYGIGFPLQISATKAAILCNLRKIVPSIWDYEDGTDVFIFDDLRTIGREEPIEISRNEKSVDPATGKPRVNVKFPVSAGFWPLGARASDGSRHPGEGRGFGVCQALMFVVDDRGLFTWEDKFVRHVEMFQFQFDGRHFEVVERELIGPERLPQISADGWTLVSPGLTSAIPDGNDLLAPILGRQGKQAMCGVCRWRFQDGRWQPESFVPVGFGSEPSLVRVTDGSLMFASRLDGKEGNTIIVWQSYGYDRPWRQIVRKANVRTFSPVSINRAVDGTPFIAANLRGSNRTKLCFWTLNNGELGELRLIRDCHQEFGPAPDGTYWAADHVSSATIKLADGKWHALLAYRLLAFPVKGSVEKVVPQTGCYAEEVLSSGEPKPEWQFADLPGQR